MTVKLYLRLWGVVLAITAGFFSINPLITKSYAQNPIAMPVEEVSEEELPALGKAPIVVELFSSQACVFCPKADRLFADLLEQDNVIGLACHIDYFDVETGSLSKPFCTQRQTWYMEKLFAGPNYTPQMVINGALDVVAYKLENVVNALQKAETSAIEELDVSESDAKGTYKVILPFEDLEVPENYKLWLALYDKPHELTIADGFNRGKKATYLNIVSELGNTENLGPEVFVTPPFKEQHAGFVVILQNIDSGKIHAVGKHQLES